MTGINQRDSRIPAMIEWTLRGLIVMVFAVSAHAEDSPPPEPPVTVSDRDHWAFTPLARPDVPQSTSAWTRNPIDHFILAALKEESLEPMPEADRTTLARRLAFDLTGLPPNAEQLQEFLADQTPTAYERYVDRLLASPEYGVRWGQHWLDLARFAETDGFEFDAVRPNAWRYRDWVIDALNADLSYQTFIQHQIAGDVLEPENAAAVIATGFLLCGPDMPDINLQAERRHTILNEMTSTVGTVFLGMTVGCAQCHHHKFDPISQHDFYRLRGFFENTDLFKDHPLPNGEVQAERAQKLADLEAEMSRWEELAIKRNGDELSLDLEAVLKVNLSPAELAKYQAVQKAWDQLRAEPLPKPGKGRVIRDRDGRPNSARLWVRGDFRRPGPEVAPAFLRVSNRKQDYPRPSGHPRVELAGRLTEPDHPLVYRVMANRLWQHHFGRGLSSSPANFGIMGQEPTHPELLDWLACELASNGSLKRMHRLLVTSATYRMTSQLRNPRWSEEKQDLAETRWKAGQNSDPENRWLWRMNRRRLEGEAIRDALLAVSGQLSGRRGGPGVRPPLPPELLSTLLKNQWLVTKDKKDHNRRSTYLFVRRNLRFPIFEVFDQPDTNSSCAQRGESTTAPQALMMWNSRLTLETAERLAKRVLDKDNPNTSQLIDNLFETVLSRVPTEQERTPSQQYFERQASLDGHEIVLRNIALALLNSNQFLYID